MRNATAVVLGLFLMLGVGSALANCPVHGVYSTTNGDLDIGRAAESEPTGQSGELGNAVQAGSWDGTGYAGQWLLSCPAICVEPDLVEDTVDAYGNGTMVYYTEYCGGTLLLNGPGEAWDNGHAEYEADLLDCAFTVTLTLVGGQVVGHETYIEVYGQFIGCAQDCFFLTAEAQQVGAGLVVDFPGYPTPVHETTCDPDVDLLGTYWNIIDANMIFDYCTTATQDSDWGQIKARF